MSSVNNSILPTSNTIYDIGSPSLKWNNIYANSIDALLDWSNLQNVPTAFVPTPHSHVRASITDFWDSPFWGNIPDKPTSFTPSPHSHSITEVTINSNIIPTNDSQFDLGTTSLRWRNVYANTIFANSLSGTIDWSQISNPQFCIAPYAGDETTVTVDTTSRVLKQLRVIKDNLLMSPSSIIFVVMGSVAVSGTTLWLYPYVGGNSLTAFTITSTSGVLQSRAYPASYLGLGWNNIQLRGKVSGSLGYTNIFEVYLK